MSDLPTKEFNFLSILTGGVVLGYVGASVVALLVDGLSFQDFSSAVGPIAGLLLGYWVRGANNGQSPP